MIDHRSLSRIASALGILAALAVSASAVRAQSYRIDTGHSSLIFRVKHNNAANFWGRFNTIAGRLNLDEANPSVEVQVKTESVNTGNTQRDDHLKSPDFFNAKQFPDITFKSTSVKKAGDDKYDVEGTLTLHGVSQPLTLQLVRTGTGRNPRGGGTLAGFETTFDIKRSEFGMKYGLDGVSDDVKLIVSLECAGT